MLYDSQALSCQYWHGTTLAFKNKMWWELSVQRLFWISAVCLTLNQRVVRWQFKRQCNFRSKQFSGNCSGNAHLSAGAVSGRSLGLSPATVLPTYHPCTRDHVFIFFIELNFENNQKFLSQHTIGVLARGHTRNCEACFHWEIWLRKTVVSRLPWDGVALIDHWSLLFDDLSIFWILETWLNCWSGANLVI